MHTLPIFCFKLLIKKKIFNNISHILYLQVFIKELNAIYRDKFKYSCITMFFIYHLVLGWI